MTTNPRVGIVCKAGKNLNTPPFRGNLVPIRTGLNLNNSLISLMDIRVKAEYFLKKELSYFSVNPTNPSESPIKIESIIEFLIFDKNG